MKIICGTIVVSLTCLFLPAAATAAQASQAAPVDTCTGTYPSYWQDVDPKFAEMWRDQDISNAPTAAHAGPVFRLSDAYPRELIDDKANQPWRAAKFNAMFNPATAQAEKARLALEYGQLVFDYALAGNINQRGRTDFDVCKNPVRPWFHMPFQTYDSAAGREFTHGLTREAPVTFSTKSGTGTASTTMWAVGIYNATAAYTIGTIWQADGTAKIPTANINFAEGAVIAKPLFNTGTLDQFPILANMPAWKANISKPDFCRCQPADGKDCTLVEQSQQCPRSYGQWNDVKLLQFDISVRDSRAQGTGWVYGTFVADGRRKAKLKDAWRRMSLLGLMWGNDTPPEGQYAYNYPPNPRKNGFKDEVIFWDTVDELNSFGGTAVMQQMGHLGSNYRLNGPADNANGSCMACHATASVPDSNHETPPIMAQFAKKSTMTPQSAAPFIGVLTKGMDRSGSMATVQNNVPFDAVDAVYFANVMAGSSFNMTVKTPGGSKNLMSDGAPHYANPAQSAWIGLDYSLQMSQSLVQWMQWQAHLNAGTPPVHRKVVKALRRNR